MIPKRYILTLFLLSPFAFSLSIFSFGVALLSFSYN